MLAAAEVPGAERSAYGRGVNVARERDIPLLPAPCQRSAREPAITESVCRAAAGAGRALLAYSALATNVCARFPRPDKRG